VRQVLIDRLRWRRRLQPLRGAVLVDT